MAVEQPIAGKTRRARPRARAKAGQVKVPSLAPSAAALAAALAATACDVPAPAPIDVVEATIAGVQEAIFSGATTCRLVVQAHLDRIEAYEDRINAITVVNPAALDRADELDAALAAGEEPGTQIVLGVNHGRESSNYIQGRTICAFCPSAASTPIA